LQDPTNILTTTTDEFVAAASVRGVRRPVALELYRRAYRDGVLDADWMTAPVGTVVRRQRDGATVKFVQRLHDGLESEAVVIPSIGGGGKPRNTLCVSSQIGCAMGCGFCETASMGLLRHLDAGEIVAQWYAARFLERAVIRNVVFMGMGEPMDNLDAVLQAIRVLTDDNGPGLAAARITVSTVGHVVGIRRLTEFCRADGFGKLRLAVSVNAARDAVRDTLMPINRAAPLATLRDAMLEWIGAGRGRRVLVEYVLIPTVNDADEDVAALRALLDIVPATVNVIPYNPRRDSPWPAPAPERVDGFIQAVHASGLRVLRRRTRGSDVWAACGQLGNERIRKRRPVTLTVS
jgi:23S rRNA (adenine2503-C2)-methyltransferase